VKAKDAKGNVSTVSNSVTFEVPDISDYADPSKPLNLALDSRVGDTLVFKWDPSTDNVGVVKYILMVADTDSEGYYYDEWNVRNLSGGTPPTTFALPLFITNEYYFVVVAVDGAGNYSVESNMVTYQFVKSTSGGTGGTGGGSGGGGTTPTDTQAPTVPTSVNANAVTGSTLTLTWIASTDNIAVTTYEIYQNSTLIGTVTAPIVAYQVTELNPATTYSFTVKAKDAAGNVSATSTLFTVTTKSAPTSINIDGSSVPENSPIDTEIGGLSAMDSDLNESFTYELVSGSGSTGNASFNIDGNMLRTSELLDYENQSSFSLRVRVTDTDGLSYEQIIIINVVDLNEAPTALSLSNNTIDENNSLNEEIGTFSAEDQDSGTTLTYLLVSGSGDEDNDKFTLIGAKLKTHTSHDFEIKSEFTIRVQVSDGIFTTEEIFEIIVNDVNEKPTSLQLSTNIAEENVWIGYTIGEFTTVDVDSGDTFTYSLVEGEGGTDNAAFKIEGNVLKSAIVFNYLTKSLYELRVRSTDSKGQVVEKALVVKVKQSNALLDKTNKIVTISFKDSIFSTVSNLNSANTLKSMITISRNSNATIPIYEALSAGDMIEIKGNRLIVKFQEQITGYYNRIKISAGALKDRFGNLMGEQLSSPLAVDDLGPNLIKVTMDKKKRKLSLLFSENIYMATAGANPKEITESFRAAIQFSKNAGDFVALDSRDKVMISGRTVDITFATALTTNDNKFKFATGALKDLLGNLSSGLETEEIDLDANGPILSKVQLAADNRTITILLNEEALITGTGTKKAKLSALKAALQLTMNADEINPTFATLSPNDVVELNKNVLVIRLAEALNGANNQIKLNEGILKDIFGNTNGKLTTSVFSADKTGPIFVNTELPIKKMNYQLVITMNETVAIGITTGKASENKIAFKSAIKISIDGGDYVALSATDSVKVNGNKILINFAKVLVKEKEYKVKIETGALQDLTGNKSGEIITEPFKVDTSGPQLR
jgi:hypothetical protein